MAGLQGAQLGTHGVGGTHEPASAKPVIVSVLISGGVYSFKFLSFSIALNSVESSFSLFIY